MIFKDCGILRIYIKLMHKRGIRIGSSYLSKVNHQTKLRS